MSKKKKKQKQSDTANKPIRLIPSNPDTKSPLITSLAIGGQDFMMSEEATGLYTAGFNTDKTPIQTTLEKVYSDCDEDEYALKLNIVKNKFHDIFDLFLSSLSDVDPILNKFRNEDNIDSIDFRECTMNEDVFETTADIINQNHDVSMLFSPSETFDIKITDVCSYRIRRMSYNPDDMSVQYCFVEYKKFKLKNNCYIDVPVNTCIVKYDIVDIKDNKSYKQTHVCDAEEMDFTPYKNADVLSSRNTDYMLKKYGSDYKAIRTQIIGYANIAHIESWFHRNHFEIPRPTYRFFKTLFSDICTEQYCATETGTMTSIDAKTRVQTHVSLSVNFPIAVIVITNHYLRKNLLSRPVNTKTEGQVEIILENKQLRKTRILNGNIRITTTDQPVSIDDEKLIKYHTPEWSRKSHLRHLKSGKVIEIKSQTCKRRCVDMSNIADIRPQTAIDYVINSKKEGDDS